eukprot:6209278-Pleurochrysis_carterae.AAC.2
MPSWPHRRDRKIRVLRKRCNTEQRGGASFCLYCPFRRTCNETDDSPKDAGRYWTAVPMASPRIIDEVVSQFVAVYI